MSVNKIRPQSPQKNKVDTYRAPVFSLDNSATTLAAKMCINSDEHSMYFDFYAISKLLSFGHKY